MENTIEYWIEKELQPRSISLWGSVAQTDFVPEICSEVEGDGQQLIYFGTVNQRPRYWLMRIDSKHDIESEEFSDKIEEIVIEPLCEEFGETKWLSEENFTAKKNRKGFSDYDVEEFDNYNDWMEEYFSYPRLSIDGFHWGLIANVVTGDIG